MSGGETAVCTWSRNLEEELAEQMANQASNESALAQSFSSLRLHVAGGGTMIILNDREITGSNVQDDGLNEEDEAQLNAFSAQSSRKGEKPSKLPTSSSGGRNPVKGLGLTNLKTGMQAQTGGLQPLRGSRRGCGAFFPPHLLAQVHQEEKTPIPQLRRGGSGTSTASKKLNAAARPFVPVASPVSSQHSRSASQFSPVSKTTALRRSNTVVSTTSGTGTGTGTGTGCFIPIYVQPEEKSTPGHKVCVA